MSFFSSSSRRDRNGPRRLRRSHWFRLALEELEPRILLTQHPVLPPDAGRVHVPHHVAGTGHAAARPKGVLQVPGLPGQTTSVRFRWIGSDASFENELGLFFVDDRTGRIGTTRPGDPGYAAAALARARRRVVFAGGTTPGATRAFDLPAGHFFSLYLIRNGTTAAFMAGNARNDLGGRPLALFPFARANPDGLPHLRWLSGHVFAWDDGGDQEHDFGDLIARVRFGTPRGKPLGGGTNSASTGGITVPKASSTGTPGPACSFPDGPGFWTAAEAGGTATGPGTATVAGCQATLREGNSFNVTLSHTFTVPAQPSLLSFSIDGPSFDTTAQHAIKDAFEAALVAGNAQPLVHTFLPGRDAFFNVSEGQAATTGAGTTFDGHTVTTDLSGLTPGSTATLIFRLVNNDSDTNTKVNITDFRIAPGGQGTPIAAVPAAEQTANRAAIDFALLSDVSPSFTPQYARTSFDLDTHQLHADLALENTGQYPAGAPLVVAVAHLSDPTVRVANADGTTPDGLPYFDLSDLAPGGTLAPGSATVGTRTLSFFNPNRVPFTYDLVVLAELNQPPAFTSQPNTEGIPGVPYTYQATAADPDGDPLTFSVASGAPGLAIDAATGKVTWAPQATDVGNHAVTLRVDDGHGASAEQPYTIGVAQAPPNQPPLFTSTPVVDASVNTPYTYQATATDPDGDHPLAFSLIAGPTGLTIDPATGLVQWTPTAAQLAATGAAPIGTDPTLPSAPGLVVSTYATITNPVGQTFETDPANVAFDPAGNLYVGMDNFGPGRPQPDLARILRIGPAGTPIENYGNTSLLDPNNVLFDATGAIAGTPGSVIVDGEDANANGIFSAILPNQSVKPLFGPSSVFPHPYNMAFDHAGRLVFDGGNGQVFLSSGGFPQALFSFPSAGGGLAIDAQNRIYTVATDGQTRRIQIHNPDGTLANDGLVVGLKIPPRDPKYGFLPVVELAIGPGGPWGNDLYVLDNGQLSRFDAQGKGSLVGTGFDPIDSIAFGPDGALYAADYRNRKIIRIAPTQAFVTLGVDDGRGGMATQSYNIAIHPEPGNLPPVIISTPPTSIARPHPVTFSDGTFNDSDWQLTVLTNGIGGYSTATQVSSGGNPNSFRQITNNTGNAPAPDKLAQLVDLHMRAGAFYTPATQGAIASIDYSEDSILITGERDGQAAGIALFQNGQFYREVSQHITPSFSWTHFQSLGLSQNDFIAFTPVSTWGNLNGESDSTKHPDFSTTGSTIQFGFFRANATSFGGGTNSEVGGIDNWSVTINPVFPTYTYNVKAIDPDGDKLTYSLKQGPQGMTIDANSGAVRWQPPADILTANAVSFFDGTFNDSDWIRTTFGHGNGGSVTSIQQSSGGNPGSYLQAIVAYNDAPNPLDVSWVLMFQRRVGAVYNPRQSGPIYAIDSSLDSLGSGALGAAGETGPALLQDGNVYAVLVGLSASVQEWITHSSPNLSQDDFALVDPSRRDVLDTAKHPDFSANGGPIQFGFVSTAGTELGAHGLTVTQNLDNWSVTIIPAPQNQVTVAVGDGRGGADTQNYVLGVSRPNEIHGFVFNDLNGNGMWDRAPSLVATTGAGFRRYDTATGQLLDVFAAVNGPIARGQMAFGPDGNLYVSDWNNDRVLRYNGVSGALIDTFVSSQSGGLVGALGLAFGPDGNLYVGGEGSNNVLRYNGVTGAFIDTFASVGLLNPFGLAFDPNGDLLVASPGTGYVARFDGHTGAFLGPFAEDGGNQCVDLTYGPDGNLYVSYFVFNQIAKFDGKTGALLGTFVGPGSGGSQGPEGLAFGPDGNLYVSSTETSQILKYDGRTGAFSGAVATISPPGDPVHLLFSPSTTSRPEPGLQGWTVFIDENHDGRLDPNDPSTTTDQFGQFAFSDLADGTYTIAEVPQSGWVQTAPAARSYQVTVSGGQIVYDINFGNMQSASVTPNQLPAFTSTAPPTATAGQLLRYDAAANDPDDDPLTFSLPIKPDGMTVDPTTGTVVWVPAAGQVGPQHVLLRVDDGRGGVALQDFTITVQQADTAPFITSTPPTPAIVGVPYQYQVRAQDALGLALKFSLAQNPSGMAIDPSSGLLTWTAAAGQVPSEAVTILATDTQGLSATQSFDLPVVANVPDTPPTITSTPRDRIGLGQTYLYQVQASDTDGDSVSFHLDQGPQGMLMDPSGLVTWQPTAAEFGANEVKVRVQDIRGSSTTQDFTVTVVSHDANQPPVIVSQPPAAATVGSLYKYDVQARDPQNEPLQFSLPEHPDGMSIDQGTGRLRWVPADDQLGPQTVTVQVQDGSGGSSTQTFTVTVRGVNVPPVITSTPPTQATVGQPYTYRVQAGDVDGDSLTYSLTAQPDPNMSIDPATGVLTWTPQANEVGNNTVALQVDDGQGGIATQTFTLVVSATPPNTPPAITSTPPLQATVGAKYQYQVTASDPDGDTAQFTLRSQPPAGTSIDPTTGLLVWTPTAAEVGANPVSVAAIDPAGNVGSQDFTVTVAAADQPPQITSSPVTTITAGLTYHYDVQAHDPDGDSLTYALSGDTRGLGIDNLGRIGGPVGIADIGTHHLVVTVTDSRGTATTQAFDLRVVADTEAPKVSLTLSENPANLGDTVTFVVSATDDVAVQTVNLTVNGMPLALDSNGRGTMTMAQAGPFAVVATATDPAGNTGTANATLTVIDPRDTSAPTVAITAPADGATIAAPVDVTGTANDSELVSYTLSVAPMATGVFTEIASGKTPVVNGVLGRFDPSGLANDTYLLKLTATNAGGHVASVETTINVAGNQKLGNFTLSFADLTVPVAGIPITVARTYDTQQAGTSQDFGYGWRLEYRNVDLRTSLPSSGLEDQDVYTPFQDGARVYITLPGGRREGFTWAPRPQGLFGLTLYSPRFVADPGVTDQLTVANASLIDNAGQYYTLDDLPYNPASPDFGGTYTLTTKDGMVYQIDGTSGQLLSMTDRNGNQLTFSDAGIASSTGTQIAFARDAQNRIVSVTDPNGKKVLYQYSAQGDLTSVTDRDGNVTQLVYRTDRPHYLDHVVDPLGRTGVQTKYDDQGRLLSSTDAAGKSVGLTYDPGHSTETVQDQLGNSTTYQYDDQGNIVTEIDANGGITRRTYDANNNLLTETDPLGKTKSFTYDGAGNVLTEKDELGNVTRHTYGPFGELLTTTDPLGNTTTNTYDAAGNLVSTTDAAGNVTHYAYDSAGNQTSITDALGGVTKFSYDAAGHETQQTDALGNVTTFTYDSNGNQLTQTTSLTTPSGVRKLVTTTAYDSNGRPTTVRDAEGNTTRTHYDANGNQTATIDALDRETQFQYDERGGLTGTLYPDGTSSTSAYDAAGRRTASTDRAGRTTNYQYDVLGRLATTIYPDATPADLSDNPRTSTQYDADGRVIAQIDELGNKTQVQYDDAGRQTAVIDALGGKTTDQYDAAGRKIAETDPLGHTTQYSYDPLGHLENTIFADGTTTSSAYDALGRQTSTTDQDGHTTQDQYDPLGRLTAVVDAVGQKTQYGYDEAGDLTSQQDANGHVTHYEYDGLGHRTATVLPLGQQSVTSYDPAGNVTSTTDFNHKTIGYEYDSNNRLTAKRYPDNTSVTFTYTPTGQQDTVTDARGTTKYQYDERDRLVSRTDPDGTTISYTYDLTGNRTSVTIPAGTTTYGFDALNRLTSVTDPSKGMTTYQYDAASNLVQTNLPNGTTETRSYDALNRLTLLKNMGPAGVISSYQYTLDSAGNRTSVLEDTGRTVNYTYDADYRLKEEAITDAVAGNRTIDYKYDPVGNRLMRNDSVEGMTTYTYDANDRLMSATLGADVTRYTYDNNGNTLSQGKDATDQTMMHWDFENRLIGADVTDASGTHHVLNQYDANGIRVSQTVDGQETRYLIDANRPFAEVLEEYQPGGAVNVSYVYGLSLISQNRGGTLSYYHVDGLGSTRALTDERGMVTDRYYYDAFGRSLGQSGKTPNAYLFAGESFDPNDGLYYLRARSYSVTLGRFVAPDAFTGGIQPSQELNKYVYVRNDPTNRVDPTGYFDLTEEELGLAIRATLITINFVSFYSNTRSALFSVMRAVNAFRAGYPVDGAGWLLRALVHGGFAVVSLVGLQAALLGSPPTGLGPALVGGIGGGSGAAVMVAALQNPLTREWILAQFIPAVSAVAGAFFSVGEGGENEGFESEHAQQRFEQGRRTEEATNDARNAREGDLFVQNRRDRPPRFALVTPSGRVHIFEFNGQLVTTINFRSGNAGALGRAATYKEFEYFTKLF